MKKRLLAAVLVLVSALPCLAEVPIRSEQTVWILLSYNGQDYSPTFVPENSDTLYLIAGARNFIAARKTLVYWWPATAEWKTDPQSLSIQFDGELEIVDGRGRATRLKAEDYTYFNVKGEYQFNWKVATGADAKAELERYAALYDSYFTAGREYQRQALAFDAEMQSLAARIARLQEEGKDYAALLERMRNLPKPTPPTAPSFYEVPPSGLQRAFILDLAPGRYRIRLVNPDGTTMEATEKAVVVHEARRRNGIGYSVMPSDKWTYPAESTTPSSVLYVNGKAELYIKPYFEDEFNDLAYEKTIDNAARGNPDIVKWVHIQQVPRATIMLRGADGDDAVLTESRFYVEQTQGTSLGYSIRDYDPATSKGKEPNLIAFKLPLKEGDRALSIRTRGSDGNPLAGSEREIRIVRPSPLAPLLAVLSLLPLIAMALVSFARIRSIDAGRAAKD